MKLTKNKGKNARIYNWSNKRKSTSFKKKKKRKSTWATKVTSENQNNKSNQSSKQKCL